MKVPRQRCIECGKKRKGCIPFMRTVEGIVEVVCGVCWRVYSYGDFLPATRALYRL
jgi:hypothetical protein